MGRRDGAAGWGRNFRRERTLFRWPARKRPVLGHAGKVFGAKPSSVYPLSTERGGVRPGETAKVGPSPARAVDGSSQEQGAVLRDPKCCYCQHSEQLPCSECCTASRQPSRECGRGGTGPSGQQYGTVSVGSRFNIFPWSCTTKQQAETAGRLAVLGFDVVRADKSGQTKGRGRARVGAESTGRSSSDRRCVSL
ncbi:unnamed protein product, partial [Amoebophrya sp. A120]|eukprot:GSA120T00002687001.1